MYERELANEKQANKLLETQLVSFVLLNTKKESSTDTILTFTSNTYFRIIKHKFSHL